MTLPAFPVTPLDSGYTQDPQSEVVGNALDGGRGRYRRDYTGNVVQVRAQWLLRGLQNDVLRAFVYTTLAGGSLPFTLRAAVLGGAVEAYEAQIVPGSLRMSRKSGDLQWWQADLEVVPATADATFDTTLVELYAIYGPQLEAMMEGVRVFANVTLPAALDWL